MATARTLVVAAMHGPVQKYDLPGCEIIGRLRFGLMSYNETPSAATDHQVVAMHHLGAAAKSQN